MPPSRYCPEKAKLICDMVRDGSNLSKIVKRPEISIGRNTFVEWCNKHDWLSEEYARAITARAEARIDRIDKYKRKALKGLIPADVARLAIDVEKWQAGKENAKRYGKSEMIKHADADGGKLSVDDILKQVSGGTTDIPSKR